MAIITPFDHLRLLALSGTIIQADNYRLALYSDFTGVDLSETTKAAIDATATELSTANGYTAGGQLLTGVSITQVGVNATFDADNVSWTASGGSIAAAFALLYNDTDTNDPPMFRIDFEGTETAGDGTPLNVNWNALGAFRLI